MYGQANYTSQYGQGPQKPWPPAYQQRAGAPPPPPPPTSYVQPGPPISSHPITQQPPPPPPQATQPLHLLQPGSHGLLPPFCQGPSVQVLPSGITNIHQTYFHTFPPVHGSTQVSVFNSNAQQNVPLSHSGVQNMHHVLPPPPPLLPPPPPPPPPQASDTDSLRPLQPSTVGPLHPPSQGQALYGARGHPPLQQGGLQVFSSIPQHPKTSTFPTPSSNFLGDSHLLPMAPPPPPSSPPPIPPSPPPPTSPPSSIPHPNSSNLKPSEIDQGGTPPSYLVDELKHDAHRTLEVSSGLMVSKVDNEILPGKDYVQVLPPSPPKPKDDRIVKKIEVLCQLIANNGSGFEETTRHKEFGNPEFEFLFGGEPGSESAIGHEYFLWMKMKYGLAIKSMEMKVKSPLRSFRIEPQSENLTASAASISPANSDMEMEDDITEADIGDETNQSFEIQSYECKSRKEEHEAKDQVQLQEPDVLRSCSPEKEKVAEDGGPKLQLNHEKSGSTAACQIHSTVGSAAGVAEHPPGNNFENSLTCLQNEKGLAGEVASSPATISSQSTTLIPGGSPFRLIQGYASDENSESDEDLHHKDVHFVAISPSTPAYSKTSDKDTDNMTILESKGSCQVQWSYVPPCESSMPESGAQFLSESPKQVADTIEANVQKTGNEQSYNGQQYQIGTATGLKSLDAMNGGSVDVPQDSDKLPKENDAEQGRLGSSPVKIDEFGRLVREGGSDSDSDDSHYTRRRKNRRSRNSSESRSPVDRRRGRRSPRRRRERRSRSRSWSPRNQRGRSRSPFNRRTSQFNNENMRRDKGMIRTCFDFQRGRCYRGASCRYVHHEPNKNDGSRLNRSKHRDVHPTSKNIKIREDTKHMSREVSDLGYSKVENQESFPPNVSPKDDSHDWKPDSPAGDPAPELLVTKCQSSIDRTGLVQDALIFSKPAEAVHVHANNDGQEAEKSYKLVTPSSQCMGNADTEKLSGDISMNMSTSVDNSVAQQSNIFVAELQTANDLSHQMDGCFVSNLLPDHVTAVTTNKAPECEHFTDKISAIKPHIDNSSAIQLPLTSQILSQPPVPKPSSASAPFCATNDAHSLTELPPPPPPPPLTISRVTGAEVPMPAPYNFVSQNVSFPSKSSLPGGFHPHQDLVSVQPTHYHSTSVLPPKPLYDSLTSVTTNAGMPMQFHQSHLSQGCDLGSQPVMNSQPLELHSHSKLGESPVQEPYRAPPMHMDEIRSIASVANNRPTQPLGLSSFQNEENFGRTSVETNSSSFFPHRSFNDYSMPVTNTNRMQSSGDSFPPSEFRSSFSQFHSYSRFQQPLYPSQPAHDSLFHGSSQMGSMSRHYPDPLSRNHPPLLPDFGGLGVTTYHNPYASTFEKPLSSSFRSNFLNFGNDAPSGDIRSSTFNVSNVHVDGQVANYVGPRQTIASPNFAKPLGMSGTGGDQYDPLFDSIEPSSPITKKSDRGQKLKKARESHMITKLGGSHKLLDVEENNKHKEVAAMTSTTSVENDEFGETADAEAGAVENDLDDEANLSGEIEIDQVKSSEKSKKSKGSRSQKFFRIAIADFVKEVLKPSWRQGNMSKEAFKTIVKKTVDKVSGAMKSHQIPKSQAKINRYIDSSQRKLTKLVMGYVDKYVKT